MIVRIPMTKTEFAYVNPDYVVYISVDETGKLTEIKLADQRVIKSIYSPDQLQVIINDAEYDFESNVRRLLNG